MIRDIFNSLGGINHFGVISTAIFLLFFIFLIINAIFLDKQHADRYGRMPLDDDMKESDESYDF